MNILITGKPRCGKTTLIKELIGLLDHTCGFYTEEIREKGKRVGFLLRTMNDKETMFAHIDFKSPFRVSKYGVDVVGFEKIAMSELKKGIERGSIIVIDEIGKMELFSRSFKEAVLSSLSTGRVLGTISFKGDDFIQKVKERKDIKLYLLTPDRYEEIKEEIIHFLPGPKVHQSSDEDGW
ncbi:MAG: nucleoside-triphosphatase [Candidatus Edwardsbacteria bacterium]